MFLDVLSAARQRALALPLPHGRSSDYLAFLAGLHDLGKISPGFQDKRHDLRPFEDEFQYRGNFEPNHGLTSGWAIVNEIAPSFGWPKPMAQRLAHSVAAHHGSFLDLRKNAGSDCYGGSFWTKLRLAAAKELAECFEVEPRSLADLPPPSWAWVVQFAGFVSVCDWLGSDESSFPMTAPGDVLEYKEKAEERAKCALDRHQWTGWRADDSLPEFRAVFDFKANPLQELCEETARAAYEPTLMIVEAPMGLGKTEAAFRAADHLVSRQGQAGVYFALPTQATSNQLFRRMRNFLERRFPDQNLQYHLLHGHSELNEDYKALRPSGIEDDNGTREGSVRAGEWFRARKRGLLAEFGVGTVDQALIGVLQARHFFVRLYGLAQKTVILDEVHAYDAYTSTLMERLILWLAALDCNVILLTATLPWQKRRDFVHAFNPTGELPASGAS